MNCPHCHSAQTTPLQRTTFLGYQVNHLPKRVVTDGLSSYPRAIKEELGEVVEHEVRGCLGNPTEQDHRVIKQRYYLTPGVTYHAIGSYAVLVKRKRPSCR